MLTAYPDMQAGLVIDWGRDGEIGDLARCSDGRYFSQVFQKATY